MRRTPHSHTQDTLLGGHPKPGTHRAATAISGPVGADEDVGHVEGRGRGDRTAHKSGDKGCESVRGGRALGTPVARKGSGTTIEHHYPPLPPFRGGSGHLKPYR